MVLVDSYTLTYEFGCFECWIPLCPLMCLVPVVVSCCGLLLWLV
jgi:hypothetical protein